MWLTWLTRRAGRTYLLQDMYTLFVDLDGVLADFDQGVIDIFGVPPEEIPVPKMWGRLARTPDFYASLSWTLDGRELWKYAAPCNPTILTGLPRGTWARPQKIRWCEHHLGAHVPVITCMSREKPARAAAVTPAGNTPILVDDRERQREPWVQMGGIFIHHRSATESIDRLRELLEPAI